MDRNEDVFFAAQVNGGGNGPVVGAHGIVQAVIRDEHARTEVSLRGVISIEPLPVVVIVVGVHEAPARRGGVCFEIPVFDLFIIGGFCRIATRSAA